MAADRRGVIPFVVTGMLTALVAAGCTGAGSSRAGPSRTPAGVSTSPTVFQRDAARARAREVRLALAAAHRRALRSAQPCAESGLRMRLVSVGAAAGTYYQAFSLRNAGRAPCVVNSLFVAYADAQLQPVGYPSGPAGRFLDETIAKLVARRALLAGERVVLRVGTPNPGDFGLNGCGERSASNEVLSINQARFVAPRQDAVVCTTKSGRPIVVLGAPQRVGGRLPKGLAQPYPA